jgi:hypothetical protein
MTDDRSYLLSASSNRDEMADLADQLLDEEDPAGAAILDLLRSGLVGNVVTLTELETDD